MPWGKACWKAMSRFEDDPSSHTDSPGEPQRDAPAPMGSNADAEDAAAHIAELVRRTTERRAAPEPSAVAGPDMTVAHPPPTPAPTVAHRPAQPAAQPVVPRTVAPAEAAQTRPTMRRPSRRVLLIAGVVVVLVGGGVALSNTLGSDAGPRAAATLKPAMPAGYTVKVTDVITDCAGHARGRTQASFKTENCTKATRLLATGQVGGRPVLFVASRIEMASAEAASSVKQILDGSGTGNLNDLLREGKTFPGAPAKMPISGYASVQSGTLVTVAEAGFVDSGRSSNTDPALRAAASQVATELSAQS